MNTTERYFKEFLKERRLKWTSQRKAILDMFLATKGHISTDELYYSLRKKYRRIGYSTVFRTLKLIKEAKLASEVNFTGKRKRFEHKEHHDHLICLKCARTMEFLDKRIESLQNQIVSKFKFKPISHRLEIFGYCKKCGEKTYA